MQIVIYKLTNGQEIIGKVVNSDLYQLDHVRVLEFTQTAPGQMGVGMYPWMISATEAAIVIDPQAVAGRVDSEKVPKALTDAYLEQTSGIQLAGPGALR